MVATGVGEREERGLSARHLILLFLAGVAVCGVFFSLGFLVGFNERFSQSTPTTERVTAPAVVPPTVNPPVETVAVTAKKSGVGHAPSTPGPNPALAPPGGGGTGPAEAPPKTAAATSPAPLPAAGTMKPVTNQQPAPTATPGEVGEGITLQVAALRSNRDAEALVNILKERGYPVFLVAPEYAQAGDNLFRVQVGPFKTRDDAEKVRAKLSQEGFKPFIRH
ncbi:MAG: SPOR domain-containing protein [Terriglobia bacterium]